MRRQLLAVSMGTLVIVAAVAIGSTGTLSQERGSAADDDRSAVLLQDVTVDQLQLEDRVIQNASINRLTVRELDTANQSIGNGTFVDVSLAQLTLEGVSTGDLGNETGTNETNETTEQPPAMTDTETETPDEAGEQQATPATPAADQVGGPDQETDGIDRVRIVNATVDSLQVDSLQFERPDSADEMAGAPPSDGGPVTPGQNDTGVPGDRNETNETTPAMPGGPIAPNETNETTPAMPGEPGGAAGPEGQSPATPAADPAQQADGAPVVVRQLNVSTLSVSEMVVTIPARDAPDEPGADQNETADGDVGGDETPVTPGPAPVTPDEDGADVTPPEPNASLPTQAATVVDTLSVESATADHGEARLVSTGENLLLTNVSAPDQVGTNETYTVTVTVANLRANNTVQHVSYRTGLLGERFELVVLDPNETSEVTFNLTSEELSEGQYVHRISAGEQQLLVGFTVGSDTGENQTEPTMPDGTPTPEGGPINTPDEETATTGGL